MTREVAESEGYDPQSAAALAAGNERTDTDYVQFNTPEAHYTNEKFVAAGNRLKDKLEQVITSLRSCRRDLALEAMGTSTHELQDFYAHSNYVEMSQRPARLDLFNLPDPSPAVYCAPGNFPQTQLTSAYWPDTPRIDGKCMHVDLNKDSPAAGERYVSARRMAISETRRYLRKVEEQIRLRFQNPEEIIQYLKSSAPGASGYCRGN